MASDVAMMQTANAIDRDHFATIGPAFDRAPAWRVLLQRIVSTVQMVILDIRTEQSIAPFDISIQFVELFSQWTRPEDDVV